MPQLKLFVLGAPRVEQNGRIIEIKPRKALALFIYLACTTQAHERDTLATLFWPDSGQKQARAALRSRLSELGATLDKDWFVAEGQALRLSPSAPLWCDLYTFQEALALNQSHQHPHDALCPTCLTALTEAAACYQDDFLRGFSLPNCPEFDEWLFFQAEGLRQDLSIVLETLIDWHQQQAEFDLAIGYARRQLLLDNLHEPAQRRLMRLYAQAGQAAAALRQYEVYCRLLEDELGVEPEAETTELANAIREKRPFTNLPSPAQPLTPQTNPILPKRVLFVARETTLRQLETALKATLNGQGQLRLITGEAGAGKSALLTEFLYQAQQTRPDLLITLATADAQTGSLDPFLLLRETLRLLRGPSRNLIGSNETNPDPSWHKSVQATFRQHGPDLLANFLPEDGKHTASQTQHLGQGEIIEQFVAVLTAVATQRPLILVFEDLHWADTASLAFIHRLGRQLQGNRIMVLGTYRPEQAYLPGQDDDQPLLKIGRELQRNLGDIIIDLEAVRTAEGRALVDGLLDSEPNQLNESFRDALYQQTQGHPLFVVELLQELKNAKDIIRDEAGCWVIGAKFDWQAMPARVEGAIGSRMAHLSEEQRWLLSVASVMGEYFLVEVVARVLEINPRHLTHLLSHVLQRQHHLVEAQEVERLGQQRLTRYRFRHNLMQVYLYERLDDVQRVYLHEDVAKSLESLYREESQRIALPLARHYQAAGITQTAVDYLQIAGEQAEHLGANLQSIEHFRQALSLLAQLPNDSEHQQQTLQLRLSLAHAYDSLNSAGLETAEAFKQVLSLARQLDDTPKTIQALLALTNNARNHTELDLAQAYGDECLRLAKKNQDPELLMMANKALFWLAHGQGHYGDAVFHIEQVLTFYRSRWPNLSLDDLYNFSVELCYAGIALAPFGLPDRALKVAEEGLALMQPHEQHYKFTSALGLSTTVCEIRGDWQKGLQLAEQMIEISQARDYPIARTYGEMHKGSCLAMLGQPEEGIVWVRQAMADRAAMNMRYSESTFLAYTAFGYGLVGQAEKGLVIVDEAIHYLETIRDHQSESAIMRMKGDLLLMQDLSGAALVTAQQEAEACFRRAIELAQNRQAKLWQARTLASLCRLHQAQGRDEGCRQQLAELYDGFSEGFETEDLRFVRGVLEEVM